jgi:hypothetical protein
MRANVKPGYTHISDIASAYGGMGRIPQKILDYCADRGTACHNLISWIMNDVPIDEKDFYFAGKNLMKIRIDEEPSYIDSWKSYWDTLDVNEILIQEERYYTEVIKLTGQVDLVARIGDETVLFDWKTSRDVGKHWLLQASGYYWMLECHDITIDKILFVKLDKEGKVPIVTEYAPEPNLFMCAYDLYMRFFKDLQVNMEME